MRSNLLGGILLIGGTSIGAGMLGLPIVAAQLGFVGSVILLIACWAIMIASAFLILEVNLWLPNNSNLISMAGATIGPVGQIISWITYLLLLYSVLCAYIAGGSDLLHYALQKVHLDFPVWGSAILFTVIFGTIVSFGVHSVDRANRILMIMKFGALLLLMVLLIPFVTLTDLAAGDMHYLRSTSIIMVTIASFGWATLIPSLRIYFAGNVRQLKYAIFIGSSIPLICYIVWDAVIMGVVPLHGANSLLTVLNSSNSTSALVGTLSVVVNNPLITLIGRFFTSICVLTSFLGVALCLIDFFSDGLSIPKKGYGHIILFILTFVPAVFVAICVPRIFIRALEYAGIYCTVLLVLLPAWMAWVGRYRRNLTAEFSVFGGKLLLATLIIIAVVIISGVLIY
jgi:tyrosine-specific transport protein